MSKNPSKADFRAFTKKAVEHKEITVDNPGSSKTYHYLQVRLTGEDANRFKSTVASIGLSVQSVLIDAVNYWMQSKNHPPVSDPGTGRKNMKS